MILSQQVINAIKAEMEKRGMSQGDVTRRTGMASANVSRLLRGKNGLPNVTTLDRLIDQALDCDVEVTLIPRDKTS